MFTLLFLTVSSVALANDFQCPTAENIPLEESVVISIITDHLTQANAGNEVARYTVLEADKEMYELCWCRRHAWDAAKIQYDALIASRATSESSRPLPNKPYALTWNRPQICIIKIRGWFKPYKPSVQKKSPQ